MTTPTLLSARGPGTMLPSTMNALVKEHAGPSYEYKEVPVPAPQGDELLVKVGKVALCGSDIALHQWNQGRRQPAPPTS